MGNGPRIRAEKMSLITFLTKVHGMMALAGLYLTARPLGTPVEHRGNPSFSVNPLTSTVAADSGYGMQRLGISGQPETHWLPPCIFRC